MFWVHHDFIFKYRTEDNFRSQFKFNGNLCYWLSENNLLILFSTNPKIYSRWQDRQPIRTRFYKHKAWRQSEGSRGKTHLWLTSNVLFTSLNVICMIQITLYWLYHSPSSWENHGTQIPMENMWRHAIGWLPILNFNINFQFWRNVKENWTVLFRKCFSSMRGILT